MTDVKDLHDWMVEHFEDHPLFQRLSDDDLVSWMQLFLTEFINVLLQQDDPIVEKLYSSTEEGQKVSRNNGDKFLAVFKRIADPYKSRNI